MIPRPQRRAFVLIMVLMVVAMLSLGAYTFCDMMLTEHRAADASGGQAQVRLLADSGIELVRAFLAQPRETQQDAGGVYDNPLAFQAQIVLVDDDADRQGYVSVISAVSDESGQTAIRFGVENESARLNLQALLLADSLAEDQDFEEESEEADGDEQGEGDEEGGSTGRDLLMALPGMTPEVADAILDWVDEDDDPRALGAEVDYYTGLSPAYAPRNGPLENIDELLLVRGVTPQLLYGRDTNRNGLIEPAEVNLPLNAELVDGTGSLDRGWAAYLTLDSKEANVTSQGLPRVWLNNDDLQQLHDELSAVLPPEWATFIVAYRQNGPYRGDEPGEPGGGGSLDLTEEGRFPLTQVLDLVGQKVRVRFDGAEELTVLASPFPDGPIAMGAYLPQLMEHVTVNPSPEIPARVNINLAPRTVLLGIPGMTEEIADNIISRRSEDADEDQTLRQHETWLLTEAIVTLDEMKALMPYVTAAGDVYRAQFLGYTPAGGPTARIEAILDATRTPPEIIRWRDLSHLGRGYEPSIGDTTGEVP